MPNQKCQTTLPLSLTDSLSHSLWTIIHTFKPALSAVTVKVPELRWFQFPLGARDAQRVQAAKPNWFNGLAVSFPLSLSLPVWMGPQIRVPVKTKWPTSFHKTEVDNGSSGNGDVLSSPSLSLSLSLALCYFLQLFPPQQEMFFNFNADCFMCI